MKKILFIVIALTFNAAFAEQALAGGGAIISSANEGPYGGGGVICGADVIPSQLCIAKGSEGCVVPKPTGQVWDLWEAEAFKAMPVTHYDDVTIEDQIKKALNTYLLLNGMLSSEVTSKVWELYQQIEVEKSQENATPAGLDITPPSDVLSPFIPTPGSSCSLKGIAAYDDTANALFVDYYLYGSLRSTDKAALFVHEAIYKYLRDHYRVENSIAARNITACLFADVPCPELSPIYEIPETGPLYQCTPQGWTESMVNELDFDIEDYRMAQPLFYVFPLKADMAATSMKLAGGFSAWRFQQTSVKQLAALSLKGFEVQTLPARSFFDVQIDTEAELDLRKDGTLMSSILSPKGTLDMIVNTFSSVNNSRPGDKWRRALGPRFKYRINPSMITGAGEVPVTRMNGFPLVCKKVR